MNPLLLLPFRQVRALVASTAGALLLSLAGQTAHAQAPVWQTATALSQTSGTAAFVQATAIDAGGNIYLTGSFTGTVQLGTTTLTSAGADDVFVAKWSAASSSIVWAQRAGGTDNDYAEAVTVNGANVYVVGSFYSNAANFGSTSLVNAGPSGTQDAFLAKLTDAGTSAGFTWAQKIGGAGSDDAKGLALSATGVYLAGSFSSTSVTFGTSTIFNSSTTGSSDVFVARLTDAGASGTFDWVRQAGGARDEFSSALVANGSNVYVGGDFFSSTAVFGANTLTNVGPSTGPNNGADAFVAKLTDTGSTTAFTWAQRAGGIANDLVYALAVNNTSVYVTGTFNSTTAGFGGLTLNNAGSADIFVTRIADAGSTSSFAWAQQAGGLGNDAGRTLAVRNGGLYLAGSFDSSTINFGAITLTNAGASGGDAFVTLLADAGASASFAWVQQAGGVGRDVALALAVSGPRLYVGGVVASPASFGNLTLSDPSGGRIGFLASLTDAQALATKSSVPLAGLELFPNPAPAGAGAVLLLPAVPGAAQVTLKLTDAVGRTVRVYTAALPAAGLQYPLNLVGLAPGVYALQVQAGATCAVRQLVID